jgi:hypothetical protein
VGSIPPTERDISDWWLFLYYLFCFGWWWLSFHTLWATRIRKKIAIIGHLTVVYISIELICILISLTGRLASFHLAQFSHRQQTKQTYRKRTNH